MKKIILSVAAIASLTAAAGAANAAPWMPINTRQAILEQRINMAQRYHRISYREAVGIRAEYRQIAQLEYRYRASYPGLTNYERADLDRRFNALSMRIRYEAHDNDRRRW